VLSFESAYYPVLFYFEGYSVPVSPLISLTDNAAVAQAANSRQTRFPLYDLLTFHLLYACAVLVHVCERLQSQKHIPSSCHALFQQHMESCMRDLYEWLLEHESDERRTVTPQKVVPLFVKMDTLANAISAMHVTALPRHISEGLNALLPLTGLVEDTTRLFNAAPQTSGLREVYPSSFILEQLSGLAQYQLPMWLDGVQGTLHNIVKTRLKSDQVDEVGESLAIHLLGVRFFGPAYYTYAVTQMFTRSSDTWSISQEPLLFQAINYFDAAVPNVVLIHQSINHVECLKEDLAQRSVNNIEPFCYELERAFPASIGYQTKDWSWAVALQGKFHQGIMPCAFQQHDTQEVWEKMHTLGLTQESNEVAEYNALHEQQAIYQLLPHINETPVKERDILQAAWLYRVDAAGDWILKATSALHDWMQSDKNARAWKSIVNSLMGMEHRSIKALETSHLHRILHVASSPPLPLAVNEAWHGYAETEATL
jgi:hypothetical protein